MSNANAPASVRAVKYAVLVLISVIGLGFAASPAVGATPTAYRAQATAICKAASTKLKTLTPPTTPDEVARFLKQSNPIFRSLRAALKRLSPPKALRVLHARALDLEQQQIDGIQDLIETIDGGADPSKAYKAVDARLTKVGNAEGATWRKLLIPACANL